MNMVRNGYECKSWIDDYLIRDIPTSSYWNDETLEKNKVFDISGGDFARLQSATAVKGILPQIADFCDGPDTGNLMGKGISLGSGVCWLEAELLKRYPSISHLTCLEFSRHRIFSLAPKLLAHERIAPERVALCLGSFYDLRVEDQSLNFVLLCQAFHHAADPDRLISEILRVLQPGGVILIVGEHYFGWKIRLDRLLRHYVKWLIDFKRYRSKTPFFPKYKHLFPGDPVKGDIHYSLEDYSEIFERFGLSWHHIKHTKSSLQGFLLKSNAA